VEDSPPSSLSPPPWFILPPSSFRNGETAIVFDGFQSVLASGACPPKAIPLHVPTSCCPKVDPPNPARIEPLSVPSLSTPLQPQGPRLYAPLLRCNDLFFIGTGNTRLNVITEESCPEALPPPLFPKSVHLPFAVPPFSIPF